MSPRSASRAVRRARRKPAFLALFLLVAACGDDGASGDGDGGASDGRVRGERDGATPADGSVARDGGGETAADGGAAVDGGPTGPGCAGRSYLFCEDFEAADVGALPDGWSVGGGWQMGGTDPTVSDAEHHSGARSLKSAVAIDGQRRAEHPLDALGAARGTHFGRVFYRVKTPAFVPSGGSVVHNTFVALLSSTGESRVVDTVIGSAGSHQFLYNLPDDSCCAGSSYDYTSYDDAWHCAEWHVDASTQSFEYWFDGTEVTDLRFSYGAGDTRARMEAFAGIALGWRNYQRPDTAYESYFDDLAIDDARIGCD